MIVLRSVVAVLLGVATAAMLASTLLLLPTAKLYGSHPSFAVAWLTLATAAVVLSAPNWLLAAILVVPLMVHRSATRVLPNTAPYLFWALVIGALAMLPTVFVLGGDGSFGAILLAAGASGGVSVALLLKVLVLNRPAITQTFPPRPSPARGEGEGLSNA